MFRFTLEKYVPNISFHFCCVFDRKYGNKSKENRTLHICIYLLKKKIQI